MPDIIGLLKGVFAGEYPFHDFVGALGQMFNDIGIGGIVTNLKGMVWFPFAAIALGLLVLCYGKKWIGLFKFVIFAGIGFAVGLAVNPFLISTLPVLDGKAWITGTLCALIMGVLCKLLYLVLYVGGTGIFVYVICYAGGLFPFPLPTEKNVVFAAVAAGVVIFAILFWRKTAEMLGTAFLGAFLITMGVKMFYDYTALLPEYAWLINTVSMCLIALLGFCYQYRRRRRYY